MKINRFEITECHLALMKRMYVGWNDCEFGAPEIDPKRPYGNSDVIQDIIEILGTEEIKEGVFQFILYGEKWLLKGEDKYNLYLDGADEEKLIQKLNALHKETQTALQICLTLQQFRTGVFEEVDFGEWKQTDNGNYVNNKEGGEE